MLVLILILLAALAPCPAVGRGWKRREVLFVTSYTGGFQDRGYVATLLLQQKKTKKKEQDKWQMDPITWDTRCGASPSSVFVDDSRGMMYCIDEGLGAPNGSITSYKLFFAPGPFRTGSFTGQFRPPRGHVITLPGGVSATTYGYSKKDWYAPTEFDRDDWLFGKVYPQISNTRGRRSPHYLAVAHYNGSALSGWKTDKSLARVYDWDLKTGAGHYIYQLDKPGPNPQRQEASHPHQALLDPTKEFLLVPDLGADMVRIYQNSRGPEASQGEGVGYLDPQPPLLIPAGCGPRHGAFVRYKSEMPKKERKKDKVYQNWNTYFHLVCELNNSIISYKVNYVKRPDGKAWFPTWSDEKGNKNLAQALEFKQIGLQNTFGGARVPEGAAAAEIVVSPDKKFVIVSNRNDSSFPDFRTKGPSYPDPREPLRKVESDSLATYSIASDGSLNFEELSPAGGSFPRSFALNKKGDVVAVALQYSKTLSFFHRNVTSGRMGREFLRQEDMGNLTSVSFWKRSVKYQGPFPGGYDAANMCLVKIDKTDPGICHKKVFHWPESFVWPEDWRKLQDYPAPGTSLIDKFPWATYDYVSDVKWIF
ncbi:Lactonase, 7-bladed beta-propeller-domain-containing protein [Phyllosticta citribraziliensis]